MAKCLTYSIQCYPAEVTGPRSGSFLMFDPKMTRHTIATDSLAVLQAGVRDIAKESGHDVCIMIGLPRGERKPRGFDAACEAVRWIAYKESASVE